MISAIGLQMGRKHPPPPRDWQVTALLLDKGASIYDVHSILGFFDPLLLSLSTKSTLVVSKCAAFLDSPPSCTVVIYESPLKARGVWNISHDTCSTIKVSFQLELNYARNASHHERPRFGPIMGIR